MASLVSAGDPGLAQAGKRILPDATYCKFSSEVGKLRRNPTHFNKAFEDDAIDFRCKKSAHQPVHRAPMIIRHEVGLASEEHFLKLPDVRSYVK
jgi:hypothetical protein